MCRVCIYCLEIKSDQDFDAEHVVQHAFGTFENNFVLDCVCRACNRYFGRELDEKLACDSFEAIERVRHGLKPASRYRSLGKRSTTFGEVTQDCPEKGARVWYVPNPSDSGIAVDFAPQVGVGKSPDGPFMWFPLDGLPEKERLYELGFERGSEVNFSIRGVKVLADALKAMAAKGYVSPSSKVEEIAPVKGRIQVESVFRIARTEMRAITKIAMNYVAAAAGPAFVKMPQFNEARRYVRHDVDAPWEMVWLSHDSESLVVSRGNVLSRGHYLTAASVAGRVVAQVALFSRLRFVVNITGSPFAIPVLVRQAHFFDLDRRIIVPIDPPPLPKRRARQTR